MSGTQAQQWITPKTLRSRELIICGAMKCGPPTVHTLLGKQPSIYSPNTGINLIDMDDIFQHAAFLLPERRQIFRP
jgi:hypothetical protein